MKVRTSDIVYWCSFSLSDTNFWYRDKFLIFIWAILSILLPFCNRLQMSSYFIFGVLGMLTFSIWTNANCFFTSPHFGLLEFSHKHATFRQWEKSVFYSIQIGTITSVKLFCFSNGKPWLNCPYGSKGKSLNGCKYNDVNYPSQASKKNILMPKQHFSSYVKWIYICPITVISSPPL